MTDTIYDELTRYTYESLHTEAMNQVADDVDKREGSVVFDMTAPAAMIIAKCFDALYQVVKQSRIQTATGEYLDLCAAQNKVYRNQATAAKWRIQVTPSTASLTAKTASVQGTRFISTNGLNYTYEVITSEGSGFYIVECLTKGSNGGRDFGELEELPIAHSLTRVAFVKCVDGGSDAETDADFRLRWWSIAKTKGYGGNFDDYKTWVLSAYAQDGGYNFDGFFIFPAFNGGGTIMLVPTIATTDGAYLPPDAAAITALKTWIDPESATGHGAGKAPVGHKVTVVAPSTQVYSVTIELKMTEGTSLTAELKTKIQNAITKYFEQMRGECATTLNSAFKSAYELTISFSSMEAAIHNQSSDIQSVTSLVLTTYVLRILRRYTSDFTLTYSATGGVNLPITGSFSITEADDE